MTKSLGINWEITRKCNLSCIYCRVSGGKAKKDELSFSQAKLIVDKLHSAGYSHLKFTGGEPLIKEYFWDLVKYAHKKDMLVSLFTNTTLINSGILPLFKKYISVVAVSLDSLNDKHNRLLNRSRSEVVVNHIKELKKLNIPVVISATVTNITINDLSDLVTCAKEFEVDEIKINDYVLNGRACDNAKLLEFKNQFSEYIPKTKKLIQDTYHEKVKSNITFKCECDAANLFINYKGDLFPCVELSYVSEIFRLGNLITDDTSKMLKQNQAFYKQIKSSDICTYSYFNSPHFSACINRDKCPISLVQYMKRAKTNLYGK